MSEKMTREEERELLELQAMLSRLKIQAAQTKSQQARQKEKSSSESMLNFATTAGNFFTNSNLLKLAMLPSSWKNRILLGGALIAWEYYRKQQNPTKKSNRRLIDITPKTRYLNNKNQ